MSHRPKIRGPRMIPGRLAVGWSETHEEVNRHRPSTLDPELVGDMLFVRGVGVPRCDGSLAYSRLCCQSPPVIRGEEWSSSFFEELVKRGYDLRTFKMTVRLKAHGYTPKVGA